MKSKSTMGCLTLTSGGMVMWAASKSQGQGFHSKNILSFDNSYYFYIVRLFWLKLISWNRALRSKSLSLSLFLIQYKQSTTTGRLRGLTESRSWREPNAVIQTTIKVPELLLFYCVCLWHGSFYLKSVYRGFNHDFTVMRVKPRVHTTIGVLARKTNQNSLKHI